MKKEIKICLPIYKLIYSMSFILILSFVRGIESVNEIGAVIQAPIALLAVIFCADTYLTEVQNHRAEIFHLYDTKRKSKVIIRRLMLQNIYLFGISLIGYGFFYLQKPIILNGTPQGLLFFLFALAMIGTLLFWSILSMTICNLWKICGLGLVQHCFYGFFSVPSLGHKYSVNGMYFPIRFVLLNTSVIWDGYVGKC